MAPRKKSESSEVAALEAEIRRHNDLYWQANAPEISDTDFDLLVRKLRELAPKSPVLQELGSKPDEFGASFTHREPMLSLDKCYEASELADWATGFEGEVVATPKFDGIACSLHYDEEGRLAVAATRGDGLKGDNITANARMIADIPQAVPAMGRPFEVRGEIYMRLSVFEKFKAEGMANPRNAAAGAIKQKDHEKSASYKLSFAPYDLLGTDDATLDAQLHHLEKMGFPKIDYVVLPPDAALTGFEKLQAVRSTLDYEIDGVVFKVNSKKEQARLGLTAHHPRYAIAYKFQGDAGSSVLREIEWSVARTGVITPIALVDPVNLSGVTVTRASLHNVAFIDKLGLTLGAKVTLVRRGGVIPNLEFVTEAGTEPVTVPTLCPSCGSLAIRERDFLYCTTPSTCRAAVIGQLGHFAGTLDMLGFGQAILEQAFDRGILKSPADFYRLTTEMLMELDRSGEKLAKKLIAEVDKKRTLPLSVFLRALGLPELGKHVSGILAAQYRTLDAVLAVSEAELAATHGIGETIAKAVVTGLRDASDLIADLRTYVRFQEEEGPTEGPLTGSSFVFTGKMVAFARSEAEKRVRERGGAVLSAVNKELTYLVVGDDKAGPKSTKEKAAEKHIEKGAAIRILSEDELLAILDALPAPKNESPAVIAAGGPKKFTKTGQGSLF